MQNYFISWLTLHFDCVGEESNLQLVQGFRCLYLFSLLIACNLICLYMVCSTYLMDASSFYSAKSLSFNLADASMPVKHSELLLPELKYNFNLI